MTISSPASADSRSRIYMRADDLGDLIWRNGVNGQDSKPTPAGLVMRDIRREVGAKECVVFVTWEASGG